MTVLVADKLEKSALDGMTALGCQVISDPDLQGDTLSAKLAETNAEVLIVRSTKVTADNINAATGLKLIIRAGAGYNTIDVDAATAKEIYVTNCPGKNAQAVSELAFALMLALDRNIAANQAEFDKGIWNKKRFSKGKGFYGRTIGLVGLGNIGKDMVLKAKAFGMNVLAFSQHTSDEEAASLGITKVSLDELAAKSDVISVHCSLRPETKGLLGADFFGKTKPGAYFINTSRAEVVDEDALFAAVQSGKLVAGLDVFDGEPTTTDGTVSSRWQNCKGVAMTHHIGAGTDQAQEAVADETVRIVKEFKAGNMPPNTVNSF